MATANGGTRQPRGDGATKLGCWVVIAVWAAGCATPDDANQPPADDRTDVWFMQHMAPHLLQDSSIAYLTRDRISDPELARLADTIHRSGQAHLGRLQGWLAERGLAPHGHSHQRGDTLRRTDLERLSRLDGHALDLTFVKVMTARHRAGSKLAATQLRDGSLPEVRQLAQQLLAEHQAQIATMTAWKRAWSKARPNHPITKALGDQPRDTRREPSVASRDRGRRRRRNSPGTSRQAGRVALDEHVGDQVLEAGGLDHEVRAAVSKREAVSWATP